MWKMKRRVIRIVMYFVALSSLVLVFSSVWNIQFDILIEPKKYSQNVLEKSSLFNRVFTAVKTEKPQPDIFELVQADKAQFESVKPVKNEKSVATDSPSVWPHDSNQSEDRILAQLDFIPKYLLDKSVVYDNIRPKYIYVHNGMPDGIPRGKRKFEQDKCLVKHCMLTDDETYATTADAVVYQVPITKPAFVKPPHQVWILYSLEAPPHVPNLDQFKRLINWTATYRLDSTIVTPYEKFVPYSEHFTPALSIESRKETSRNYAAGKTQMVAWFVSNCAAGNGRLNYAEELAKYIDVDIYGHCGTLKCLRDNSNSCFKKLDMEYKFYLAFENSHCKEYITEKFFRNGLSNDVIPVVMGARREDYAKVAPPHSYIHVDDFESPRHLAMYLLKLDQNDTLYNDYFRWKRSGDYIDTKFWCRVCSMLHEASNHVTWYEDIQDWWDHSGTCVENSDDNLWASWLD